MTARIGVVGVGNIGTAHARNLARVVSGSRVSAVYDTDRQRAAAVAGELDAAVADSPEQLIARTDVDGVVIASPDHLHAAQALACIAARKPALCEKPLSPDLDDAVAVMRAEVAVGTRLVTLGFMRRFDPGYVELRGRIEAGEIGEPLLVRNIHRNREVPRTQTTAVSLTNSAVHEIDVSRWLLGTEYESVQVVSGKPSPHAGDSLRDPILVLLRTTSGVIVEIELFGNSRFGYEVRCEVVASEGTLDMGDRAFVTVAREGQRGRAVPPEWLGRFGDAYRIELQAWVDSIAAGVATGPSVWDGYTATAVANACVAALDADTSVPVVLVAKPDLY